MSRFTRQAPAVQSLFQDRPAPSPGGGNDPPVNQSPGPTHGHPVGRVGHITRKKTMNQIVYIVGAIVIVLAILSFIGLR